MDKLIFTALGAASNQSFQRVQLTNDLANISTVGYKRSQSSRPESAALNGPGFPTRFQPIVPSRVERVLLDTGTRMETGNLLGPNRLLSTAQGFLLAFSQSFLRVLSAFYWTQGLAWRPVIRSILR